MKILITGNLGYLGPTVCRHLHLVMPSAHLVGFDSGYFADCLTVPALSAHEIPHEQILGDMRALPSTLLDGFDAVIHLAAISNDPMGKTFERVTRDVNFVSSVELARQAKARGVSRFVFASSCSVYGLDDGTLKSESSALHPLTAYAQSKIDTEGELQGLAGPEFKVTALRFATACGFSARCRLDLVLNDFVASALSAGEISLLSDGTPWRPLIHVGDMARAMEWALTREAGGDFLAINAGSAHWNYRIRDLAHCVATELGGLPVRFNSQAAPDKRSYRVDFSLFRSLAPQHQPQWDLRTAVNDLAAGLKPIVPNGFAFRQSPMIRLQLLSELVSTGQLDADLFWV